MKKKFGLIFATMLSTAVLAQTPPPPGTPPPLAPAPDTSAPATPPTAAPVTPPESTNAPAKKSTKKKSTAKKKSTKTKTAAAPAAALPPAEPLVPNEPATVRQNNINIRGKANINSEVIGHLQKGEVVTVIEEVTLKHPKTDEPAKWAKIALPASIHVWVNTSFVDTTNNVVSARKLNLRSGPSENYSVIGMLVKGDAIKPSGTAKGQWLQIEAPTNSFAFVAAHLLTHKAPEAPAIAQQTPPPQPPQQIPQPTPTPTPIPPQGQIAPPSSETPGGQQPAAPLPPIAPAPNAPATGEEVTVPRVIEREGIVGSTVSIQAPSHFELKSLDDGSLMDYLYTTSTNLSLKLYKGRTVVVAGEESLDERWPNTPVLTIKRIQVVK